MSARNSNIAKLRGTLQRLLHLLRCDEKIVGFNLVVVTGGRNYELGYYDGQRWEHVS
jgi:hypothetical protein